MRKYIVLAQIQQKNKGKGHERQTSMKWMSKSTTLTKRHRKTPKTKHQIHQLIQTKINTTLGLTEWEFVEGGGGRIAQNQNKVFNYHTLLFTHKYKHSLNPHALLHSHLIIFPLYPKCCLTFRHFCLYIRTGISWKKTTTHWSEAASDFKRVSCEPAAALVLTTAREGGKSREFCFVATPSWNTSIGHAGKQGEELNSLAIYIPPVNHERFWSELRGDLKAVTVRNDPSLTNQPSICQSAQTRDL